MLGLIKASSYVFTEYQYGYLHYNFKSTFLIKNTTW